MTYVKDLFLGQSTRFFLWYPVFIGMGCGFYFSAGYNYPIFPFFVTATLCGVIRYFLRASFAKYLPVFVLCICIGYVASAVRTSMIKTPLLAFPLYYTHVTGSVDKIYVVKNKYHIILNIISIEKLKNKLLPKKIHFTSYDAFFKNNIIKENDIISCKATLNPLGPKPLPRSYHFTRHAFFQKIGAKGYIIGDITVRHSATKDHALFDFSHLRQKFHKRILDVLPGTEGAIASALLTGERGDIAENINQEMRISGLYHILSISGLHMVMVTSCLFYAIRALLACVPFIALRFSSKKIAAFFSILGGLFYLLLADAPIPAQRAFIVSGFFLSAILINRNAHPMRSIAYGAACILLFQPESIVTPSFHMSFAATIALVAYYEGNTHSTKKVNIYYNGLKIFLNHLVLLVSSSAIASLATLPFTLYHFNNYTSYGVFSNLLAVPLSNFWIMPLGIGALFLMCVHLESYLLIPMGVGIDYLIKISHFFASLPYATGSFSRLSLTSLFIISFSLLWIIIWQGNIRWYGMIGIIGSFFFFNTTPDVIISSKGNAWGVVNEEGSLWFSSTKNSFYEKKLWRDYVKDIHPHSSPLIPSFVSCDETSTCIIRKNQKSIAIFSKDMFTQEECDLNDIIVNLTPSPVYCRNGTHVIQKRDLQRNGTCFLTFKNKTILIENNDTKKEKRPWDSGYR